MMIYQCKKCGAEYELREISFEGETFCECGGMELKFLKIVKEVIYDKS